MKLELRTPNTGNPHVDEVWIDMLMDGRHAGTMYKRDAERLRLHLSMLYKVAAEVESCASYIKGHGLTPEETE